MGDKISGYPAKTTIHDDDLLDFSNTEDSGVSYDASQKVKVSEFMAHINSFSQTIYNLDGNINETRVVTSNGATTTWLGGDLIVRMDNLLDDYAFLIMDESFAEKGRYGFDQLNSSAELSLSNLSGEFLKANNGSLLIGSPTLLITLSSEEGINSDDAYYIDNTKILGAIGGSIALGVNALSSITSGSLNTAIGSGTLGSSSTAIRNFAGGYNCLGNLTGALQNHNVGIGFSSGISLTSGQQNVFVGSGSAANVSIGSGNIMLGYNSGGTTLSTYNSSVAIGNNALVDSSNQLVIGSSSSYIGEAYFGSGIERTTIVPTSLDMRITNITDGETDTAPNFDWVWNGSQGTGTGVGSDHVWKVAPAGSTGTTRNSLVEVLRLKGDGNINMPNLPTSSAGLSSGDLWNDSGVLSVV
mgnify:FL=1